MSITKGNQFCSKCHNFLFIDDEGGKLRFVCHECGNAEQPPEDRVVLVYESGIVSGIGFYSNGEARRHMSRDEVNPKIHAKCSKCDSKVLTYQRHRETMQRLFVCDGCGITWLEERRVEESH